MLGAAQGMCTNKELAYWQWINGVILSFPPASLSDKPILESYTRAFPQWTTLTFTPELGYFLNKAGLETFPVTVTDVITFMQPNRLFN